MEDKKKHIDFEAYVHTRFHDILNKLAVIKGYQEMAIAALTKGEQVES